METSGAFARIICYCCNSVCLVITPLFVVADLGSPTVFQTWILLPHLRSWLFSWAQKRRWPWPLRVCDKHKKKYTCSSRCIKYFFIRCTMHIMLQPLKLLSSSSHSPTTNILQRALVDVSNGSEYFRAPFPWYESYGNVRISQDVCISDLMRERERERHRLWCLGPFHVHEAHRGWLIFVHGECLPTHWAKHGNTRMEIGWLLFLSRGRMHLEKTTLAHYQILRTSSFVILLTWHTVYHALS